MIYATPQEQGIQILYSLIFGFGIGTIYEAFRFFQAFFNIWISGYEVNRQNKHTFMKKICIIFQIILDLIFSIVYTILVMIFIYGANDGQIRFFLLLFSALGFALYYFTVGKLFLKVENGLASLVCRLINAVIRAVKKPCRAIAAKRASHNAEKYFRKQFKETLLPQRLLNQRLIK